jgi:hypothetical protein
MSKKSSASSKKSASSKTSSASQLVKTHSNASMKSSAAKIQSQPEIIPLSKSSKSLAAEVAPEPAAAAPIPVVAEEEVSQPKVAVSSE